MAYNKLKQPGHLRQRCNPFLETGNTTSPISPRSNNDDWVDPFGDNTHHKRHIYQLWLVLRYVVLKVLLPFCIVLVALNVTSSGTSRSGNFGAVRLTYGRDLRYMSLDKKYDFLWQEDVDQDRGRIRLPIDGSLGPAEAEEGVIGMFHGLQCLGTMRMALQRAHYGGHIGLDETEESQLAPCLWYLRQALLCYGDGTIELPRFDNGTMGSGSISGVTDVRQCRSADKLRKLKEEYGAELASEKHVGF